MAKISREEIARRSGMLFGWNVLKEDGIDGLENELEYREETHTPICLTKQEAERYIQGPKHRSTDTIMVLAMITLLDEFGMKKKRLEKFRAAYEQKVEEYLEKPYTELKSNLEEIKEKIGEIGGLGMNPEKVKENPLEEMRRDGMKYVLNLARNNGIKSVQEELKKRGIKPEKIKVSKPEISSFVKQVQTTVVDMVFGITILAIRETFRFGLERMDRFFKRFWLKAECTEEGLVTWDEQNSILKDEVKIFVDIRYLEGEEVA